MLNWIKQRLFGITLDQALNQTKKVRCCGVNFQIRKIDPLQWMQGSDAAVNTIATWTDKRKMDKAQEQQDTEKALKGLREHQKETFLVAVAKPVLTVDGADDSINVDEIFAIPGLADELYQQILYYTYGKKKITSLMSRGLGRSK